MTTIPVHERVTVRHAHAADERALARLAALDSGQAPTGPASSWPRARSAVRASPRSRGHPLAAPRPARRRLSLARAGAPASNAAGTGPARCAPMIASWRPG